MNYRLTAFCFAESTDLKSFKVAFTAKLESSSGTELLYLTSHRGWICVYNHGTVVFANVSEAEQSSILELLRKHSINPLSQLLREDYLLTTKGGGATRCTEQAIVIPRFSLPALRIAMLTMAHTVALDNYSQIADNLLAEVRKYANEMEQRGKLKISRTNMRKFIGRTLNVKNRIVENLYLFDQPDIVWDDPLLRKIYDSMTANFDLRTRFKEIEYTFRIIDDNVSMFNDLFMHRESSRLEWIIIILIAIEVVNMFLSKIFY